ncbi:DDT domain-containing protein DDR4 [Vitis vinifera]|uniref:DDT domain-containing protein DDR4 n=1 Tax=Vitis vinifera TaxID=29760 RepID=A0A438DJ97_VITVI|nr:DDT domain-containing protein DDR4 [Vitis vinifera]
MMFEGKCFFSKPYIISRLHAPAIPPVTRMALTRGTWVTVLCRKLRDWWHWVAEGEIPIVASQGAEVGMYNALDPGVRVVILKALCDIRVEQEDIRIFIDNSIKHGVQLSAFRKERVGGDSHGISYWYEDDPIVGHRLYREIRKVEVKKAKVKGSQCLPNASYQWETVATNLDEFQDVFLFSGGRITLINKFIPCIPALVVEYWRSCKASPPLPRPLPPFLESMSNNLRYDVSCLVMLSRTQISASPTRKLIFIDVGIIMRPRIAPSSFLTEKGRSLDAALMSMIDLGLKVNLDKSKLFPVGNVENVEELASDLGCKVGSLPSTYLGMPLGAPLQDKVGADSERFPVGRWALVRRPYLVRWATVCLDKRKGGLGVKSLSTLNKALLCKWSWCFANERGALWNQVIRGKFGEERGGWCSRDVSFWKDTWCGDAPLCVSFPPLFTLADPKEASVKDVWSGTGGLSWSPCLLGPLMIGRWKRWRAFCKKLRGGGLSAMLCGQKLIMEEEDRVQWMETKDGIFLTKSLYKALESGSSVLFPMKNIWKSCVQPKVSSSLGRLLGWKRNPLTTSFFIVKRRALWEMLFTLFGVSWVFSSLGKPYWVGLVPLWERSTRLFGERVLFAFFGLFGRLGIESPLKMRCCPSKG